jgi:DNA-binding winged helix-turn-helix (wHTH) protein/tetratricopeptide (TPR) repeat protein
LLRQKVRFAEFEVDFTQHELRKCGIRVRLQHKPFRILEMLLKQPGELVSRQQLADALWPGLHVSFERGLNTAVNVLRQTLGDSSHECRFIETRSGLGYRFIAPVDEVAAQPQPVPCPDIREDYLKGRFFLNKMTEDALWKAIAYFESILAQDSRYAAAYAGLADAYCQSALLASIQGDNTAQKARQYAAAALQHDAGLAEAHVSLGRVKMLFDWDWPAARTEYLRALELNPGSADSHRAFALFLSANGNSEEALSESSQALLLDPLSCPISSEHAWHLHLSGNFQGAVEQCWKVLTLEPAFAPAQYILGLAYQQLDMHEEAIVELQNADQVSSDHPAPVASLGNVYATAGMREQATEMLQELDRRSQRRYVSPYWQALIYTGLGENEQALELIERARQQRDSALLWVNVDPRVATLGVRTGQLASPLTTTLSR